MPERTIAQACPASIWPVERAAKVAGKSVVRAWASEMRACTVRSETRMAAKKTDDPQALAQNVAAYTVFAYLAAEADGSFGSEAKATTPPNE